MFKNKVNDDLVTKLSSLCGYTSCIYNIFDDILRDNPEMNVIRFANVKMKQLENEVQMNKNKKKFLEA